MGSSRSADQFLQPELEVQVSNAQRLIDAYVHWPDQFQVGRAQSMVQIEIVDFINPRVETVRTVVSLAQTGSVANALALCRGLLEDVLLLRLMVRGYRYFDVLECDDMSSEEFTVFLDEQRAILDEMLLKGTSGSLIEIRRHWRNRKAALYVKEGLHDSEDPDVRIPLHYFYFRAFRPEAKSLRPQDYLQYLPMGNELKESWKEHRSEASKTYRHYLSYAAMRECLVLNDLADRGMVKRLEAHYTFLGRFVHPTHASARELHRDPNAYADRTYPGMPSGYTPAARLLALLYANFLLAHLLEEFCLLLENSSPKYVGQAGTQELWNAVREALSIRYFWFLENEASDYDKFVWAIHKVSVDRLERLGGYQAIPSSEIAFNPDVYGNLRNALCGWSNLKVGEYIPPIATR